MSLPTISDGQFYERIVMRSDPLVNRIKNEKALKEFAFFNCRVTETLALMTVDANGTNIRAV